MKQSVIKGTVLVLITAVLLYGMYVGLQDRVSLTYSEHLEDVAATVDGKDITLADIAMYVCYVERKVEEDAALYNPENTRDYWNAHINQVSISGGAKKSALGMAVHDRVFYDAAVAQGMTLSEDEEAYVANEIRDFWMDLLDEQKEHMPVTDEQIEDSIRKMALAQKYQRWLAEKNGRRYAEFDWDGYDYEMLFSAAHTQKINEVIWRRVHFGNITLVHDKVNYINGMTEEEREIKKNTVRDRNRDLLDMFRNGDSKEENDSETDKDRKK